ncbi:MAG: transporter substrate-binding domain-containing protein, partial [Cellulosilyticaceae bacterium]
STPYLNNKQVIVTLTDSDIQEKADLAGKKVGAQSESSAVTAMEKEADLYASFDGGKAVTFEDNNMALMDLEAGRVDAVVSDAVLVRYYVTLKGADKYRVLEEDFGDEQYGVGIRKGDTKMVDAFNKAYQEMKDDGTLKTISEKWFSEDITN